MNSSPSQWIDFDPALLDGSGVSRYGIVAIEEVDADSRRIYADWIASGRHGGMDYMERYDEVRCNPALLLDGAQSMICCAIPYYPTPEADAKPRLRIARYALGSDYHEVVRKNLEEVGRRIEARYGGRTRICVDTAPLRERYWAARAGLGFIGRNNQLIIPGQGSYCFLAEIITTAPLRPYRHAMPESADAHPCEGCDRCRRACPTGALMPDGSCDASRCLSYLTIEHRGPHPECTDLHGTFYGCDRCAEACPHNSSPRATTITRLLPRQALLDLTADQVASMTQQEFSTIFSHNAMKRAKLVGLRRNLRLD